MKKLLQIILSLILSFPAYSQADNPFLSVLNKIRGDKHQLTYNGEKQKQVDRYVAGAAFKSYHHSGMNCGEVIAQSMTGTDFIDLWMRSRKHRKIMLDKKYKSMASKIVRLPDGNYQAVIQFY